MAWTSVTFAYGSVLTSAKMTQLQDNFTAVAQALSGAPAIVSLKSSSMIDAATGAVYVGDSPDTTNTTTTYVEIANFCILQDGTYSVRFLLSCSNAGSAAYGRIYKNGSAFGTEQSANSVGSWTTKTENLAFVVGDTVQLFLKGATNGNSHYAKGLSFGTAADYLIAPPLPIYLGDR